MSDLKCEMCGETEFVLGSVACANPECELHGVFIDTANINKEKDN